MGEALCDGAVLWVVCEAVRDHHVEGAVAVGILAREQDALLGLDELDRCVENERAHVVVACEAARRFVHLLQLPAELAVPLAFDLLPFFRRRKSIGLGLVPPLFPLANISTHVLA